MTERVDVKIQGDASSIKAASSQSAAAISQAAALMKSKLAEIQSAAKTSFNSVGAVSKEAAGQVEQTRSRMGTAIDRLKGTMSEMSAAFKKGFNDAARASEAGADKVEADARRMNTASGIAAKGFSALKGLAVGYVASLGTQAVIGAISAGLDYAASLAEQATQLGVTTNALQEYRYAGSQTGLKSAEMDMALTQLTKRLGEAAAGTKTQAEQFKKLGIDLRSANGEIIDAAEAIPLIADAMKDIASPAERAAILTDLFGKAGQKLEPLLAGGTEGITNLRNAAHELGIVLSADQIARADETADKLDALKQVLSARIAGAVSDNANSILALANALSTLVVAAGEAVRAYERFKLTQGLWESKANRTAYSVQDFFTGGNSADKYANKERLFRGALDKLDAPKPRKGGRFTVSDDVLYGTKPDRFAPKSDRPSTITPMASKAAPKGGGGGGTKAAPKSAFDGWRTALQDGQQAEEMAGRDTLGWTVQFWQQKVALTKNGSKEELEVKRELARAQIAQMREAKQEDLANIKQLEALHREAARTDIELSRMALEAKLDDIDEASSAGLISGIKALEIKADINRQLYQLDADLERKEYALELNGLQRQQALYLAGTKQYREYTRQIELLTAKHNQRIAILSGQSARKQIADERSILSVKRQAMQAWTGAWAQNIAKLVTLQQGFGATLKGIWSSMVGMFEQGITRMVQQWIIGLLMKETASTAASRKEIFKSAREAAAGAFNAVVKIPIIGPFLAPPAAAAAFAAVMAFSAKDGYDVPAMAGSGVDGRGGQIGIVHPREMILPADLADKVRSGGGGGMNITVSALDGHSVRRMFMDHKGPIAEALRSYHRAGGR